MGFPHTHLAQTDDGRDFLGRLDRTTGNKEYFNSGVDPGKPYRENRGVAGRITGSGAEEFLGERTEGSYDMSIVLPVGLRVVTPHLHPEGEIVRVLRGTYYDVGIKADNILQKYTQGDVVYYAAGSVHRPITPEDEGAELLYTGLGKLVPFKSRTPANVADRLSEIRVPENAAEYLAKFLFPDDFEAQQRLLGKMFPSLEAQ